MQNPYQRIRFFPPSECVVHACRGMGKFGFFKTSHSASERSYYFGKHGTPFKIRISDHKDPSKNSDVAYDLVFDNPTIMADIEYQVKHAAEVFRGKTNHNRGMIFR